jgi:hypothetical protein
MTTTVVATVLAIAMARSALGQTTETTPVKVPDSATAVSIAEDSKYRPTYKFTNSPGRESVPSLYGLKLRTVKNTTSRKITTITG